MNHKYWGVILAVLLSSILLVSSTSTVSTPAIQNAEAQQLSRWERNWEYHNANAWGTNYNPQTQLNSGNVEHLEVKWMYPIPSSVDVGQNEIPGFGSVEGSMAVPLIIDGNVYLILNRKTVLAMDASDGSSIWDAAYVTEADNARNAAPEGGRLPITAEFAHTHAMHYIAEKGGGTLWFTDFGCKMTGINADDGSHYKSFEDLCLEIPLDSPLGKGIPGNSGYFGSLQPHPPQFLNSRNLVYYSQGGAGEGTWGGRNYIAAHDANTGDVVWRTYLMPPCGDPDSLAKTEVACEPLFEKEKAEWGDWLVDNCDKWWIQAKTPHTTNKAPVVPDVPAIKSCEMNQDILRNDWGKMVGNSGISNIWGQMVIDQEDEKLIVGTAQPGPDWNATFRPGPNLFASAILKIDAVTGEIDWAYQTTTRDPWDYDCSWNTILAEDVVVKGELRDKVVIKGCKNGRVHILDYADGTPLHIFESVNTRRTPFAELLDPLNDVEMVRRTANTCDSAQIKYANHEECGNRPYWLNCPAVGCLESDITYNHDLNMVFFSTFNEPRWTQAGNAVGPCSVCGMAASVPQPDSYDVQINATVNAFDVDTGVNVWNYFIDNRGFRGGTITTADLVFFSGVDGVSRALHAETGEVLHEFNIGQGSVVQPSIGADKDGNIMLFRTVGGANWFGFGNLGVESVTPGAIFAFGLPDVIPEPLQAEIIEVERIVEVEVVKEVEVIKEVEVTVTEEVISPISYVAIGLGVILVVVAGVLYSRTRNA
ncbi:MAG: hypothetical protein HS052_02560 [Thaumarchaeota archaeon]|nr:hypothetical protein [Nitrososphaerota archaeon]